MEGVNSQLSRVKETLLYTSCKVFYPQMTLQPSLFVRWLAGLTEQREVNAATLRGETPKPGARRRAAADELAFPPVHSPSTSLTEPLGRRASCSQKGQFASGARLALVTRIVREDS